MWRPRIMRVTRICCRDYNDLGLGRYQEGGRYESSDGRALGRARDHGGTGGDVFYLRVALTRDLKQGRTAPLLEKAVGGTAFNT